MGEAIGLLAGPEGLIGVAGAVMTESISADIAAQLEQGGEVAYTANSTGETITVGRDAVSKNKIEISGLVFTGDGLAFEEAVATEDAVAGRIGVFTEEGEVARLAVITPEEEDEETLSKK